MKIKAHHQQPQHPALLCFPKIKDVTNEKPFSEEKGSKMGHVTKTSLEKKKKRKKLKTTHANRI